MLNTDLPSPSNHSAGTAPSPANFRHPIRLIKPLPVLQLTLPLQRPRCQLMKDLVESYSSILFFSFLTALRFISPSHFGFHELVDQVSRVRILVPLKTSRVEGAVELNVLPLAWCGSLEKGFQISSLNRGSNEIPNR
ncbi:hypothetical protein TNCV_4534191 [Trichonephila clavipes]|nr:hypothetical protein TNCV_4534191 [Trichonephila clavipes]